MPKECRNPNAQTNAAIPDSLVWISSLRISFVIRHWSFGFQSWQQPRAVKSFAEIGRCRIEVLGRTVAQGDNAQSNPIRQIGRSLDLIGAGRFTGELDRKPA